MKLETILSNLINSETLNINMQETQPEKKFPFLVGNNFNMVLQKENNLYTLTIKYNYTSGWLDYNISNNVNIIQEDTYLASYPLNLLLCNELIGYGLFFNKNTLYYGILNPNWYKKDTIPNSQELLNDYLKGIEK